jgi:hypothetical protein
MSAIVKRALAEQVARRERLRRMRRLEPVPKPVVAEPAADDKRLPVDTVVYFRDGRAMRYQVLIVPTVYCGR